MGDQVAITNGLTRIEEFLEKMEEEARIVRRMIVGLLEEINPVVGEDDM